MRGRTTSTMTATWHLVLGRDGTVLVATDGAPARWVGTRLEECADAPEDLKAAGRALLDRAIHEAGPVSTSPLVPSMDSQICVTVIDALPLRRQPVDIGALLRSSLSALSRQAKAADITLNLVIDDRIPPRLWLDADKIAWVATALVGNALRYVRRGSFTMPSGSITVRATYNSAGPEVTLEVQDDGPGIAADKLGLLFSDHPNQPRMALGLLMVRDVVAAHGGHVEVHSDTEVFLSGTTVRLTLPVW